MNKIKFFMGLWASKFYLFISKIFGRSRDDRAGLLAYRFDDNFLAHLNKPKLVIGVTGTNGKSTVSSLVNDIFKLENKKVAYNDWFANNLAGHARCLLDAVTIFNKPRKDVAVLEMDEMTLGDTMPNAGLDYLIITNISRDSIRRNAYPSFIASKIKEALDASPKSKIIVNADDPILTSMDIKNKCIYYSLAKTRNEIVKYNADDFPVCPKCFEKIEYEYQHYRHIGKFHCPNCGFKSKKSDYIGKHINKENMTFEAQKGNKKTTFNLISPSIFNVFNLLSVIALFKELKMDDKTLNNHIKNIKIPISREDNVTCKDKEICLQIAKGQNVSATSTVFEYVSSMKENIELVLILNEVGCVKDKTETITWLYETDFSFLNKPNIKKIIVGSYLGADYKIAMILAGIDENKIVIAKDEMDTVNYVTFEDIDKVVILYEVEFISGSKKVRDKIVEKLEKSGEK